MTGLALWVSRLSLAEVEEGDLPTPGPICRIVSFQIHGSM